MVDVKAGRELDARIASRVMGWSDITLEVDGEYRGAYIPADERDNVPRDGEVEGYYERIPNYSTDRSDAEKVIRELNELGWEITIEPIKAADSDRTVVRARKLDGTAS